MAYNMPFIVSDLIPTQRDVRLSIFQGGAASRRAVDAVAAGIFNRRVVSLFVEGAPTELSMQQRPEMLPPRGWQESAQRHPARDTRKKSSLSLKKKFFETKGFNLSKDDPMRSQAPRPLQAILPANYKDWENCGR